MSKTIIEQAQKSAKWLRDYILDVFYNESILSDHVQRSTEDLDIIKMALEKAQKQENLLNKIKEIIDRPHTYIASMLESSNRYYEIEKLIKENRR